MVRRCSGTSGVVFEGFTTERIAADSVAVNVCHGGTGPPLLLLHGYPQTHVMWHLIAPALAQRFTVICPDLRGCGDSDKPHGGGDHGAYSKRVMALDEVAVMRYFGFQRFAVAGHDRGARVALRLTLDHSDAVSRLALLDIIPTATIYATIDQARATTVWRYFFLIQPHDLPERLIAGDRRGYLHWTLNEWCTTPGALQEHAIAEYERCFDPATVHATCGDYRAGATIDLEHDRSDTRRQLDCPTLVLWSKPGLGHSYDVHRIWHERAPHFTGTALDCGHFLAEERPQEVIDALQALLPS
jgi:haloacetate dehalogenase